MEFDGIANFFSSLLPYLNNILVLLLFRLQTTAIVALYAFNFQECLLDNFCFFGRYFDIRNSKCGTRLGCIAEANILNLVCRFGCFFIASDLIDRSNQITDSTFFQDLIVVADRFWQNIIEYRPTNRCID